MCDTRHIPECLAQRPGSACAAPAPREINNYYSRHHNKQLRNDCCKGSCYCPDDCCCPHCGLLGRFADVDACDPCAIMDCSPPPECICKIKNNNCHSPRSRSRSPSPSPCCTSTCKVRRNSPDCCCHGGTPAPATCCGGEPQCCPPYCPPPRKPICYPPIKCYESDCNGPKERISYCPPPIPPQPKYCTCGLPNPCDCNLSWKRRQMQCEMAPCCRRCGRKVYAAEKIMASGGAFHSSCFSCYCCHKPLEITNVFANQGEIYCKQCYAKFFGVQGYGYGLTLNSPL